MTDFSAVGAEWPFEEMRQESDIGHEPVAPAIADIADVRGQERVHRKLPCIHGLSMAALAFAVSLWAVGKAIQLPFRSESSTSRLGGRS